MTPAARPATHPSAPVAERDRGAILAFILVIMVIGGLVVVSTLNYAVTTMRANTTLSDKTQRVETIKSGLRLALADPVQLYEDCGAGGPNTPVTLAPMSINGETATTRCYFIDFQSAQAANELRTGLISTRVGTAPPPELIGTTFVPTDPASATEWTGFTTPTSTTDMVWLPNLPTHGLNVRSAAGTTMPPEFPECTVYFPGTYSDPLLLDGPTYFTSGIYYFTDEVRVVGGGSVVAGLGAIPGCTSDQEAAFYAENVPGTHNISGLGATFVFGEQGRLVTDDSNGSALSLQFNTRYVAEGNDGDAPSAGVSIMTVNGELATDGLSINALDVPGVINVPSPMVGQEAPTPAFDQSYLPSTLTPRPKAPNAPTGVTAQRYIGAAVISWTAPSDNGDPITGYTVTASPGGATCSTAGATTCAITGLASTPTTFNVVAFNNTGPSPASTPSSPVTPGGSTALSLPATPAAPTVVPYSGAVRATWTAPSSGPAPITSYTVTASPGGATCTLNVNTALPPNPLQCEITGLTNSLLYTFTVTATNAAGSRTSAASLPVIPLLGLGAPPAPPLPPPPGMYRPTPVVELALGGAPVSQVTIPGYVSVPQGRLRVDNPAGDGIQVAGGILAAMFDVVDGRASGPGTVEMGFLNAEVQRKFRIVTTTDGGGETSTAIVQINQNGAYAINSWEVQ